MCGGLIIVFSGTLHGVGSATSTSGVVGSTVGPSLGYLGRRLQVIIIIIFVVGFFPKKKKHTHNEKFFI